MVERPIPQEEEKQIDTRAAGGLRDADDEGFRSGRTHRPRGLLRATASAKAHGIYIARGSDRKRAHASTFKKIGNPFFQDHIF